MHSIIILLSTYNGERYLREQIDSLLQQEGVQLTILARDDGSTDSTVSILKEYETDYENFSFYCGENCGPARSFIDLICKAGEAEYYALCDQDDVWDKDKLSVAVSMLAKFDSKSPNLYYSNLRIVDENLNFYRLSHSGYFYAENKYSSLTENLCTGCTAVFNRKAGEMIAKNPPKQCTMHDTWLYMVCKLLGNTVYDENPHISYRQHGGNVVGTYLKKSKAKMMREKFLRLFKRGLQPRYVNAVNFKECFDDVIPDDVRLKIEEIINYKKSPKDRFKLFFDREIKASTKYGDLRFRLHVLWGTV